MSLLLNKMEYFQIKIPVQSADGEGGQMRTYENGEKFLGAIVKNSSPEAEIAYKQTGKGVYTLTTSRSVSLPYHVIFVRLADNNAFRVTSGGIESETPMTATIDMRQVNAEDYKL